MRNFSTILALIGVVSVLALTGCLSGGEESGERGGSESAEHSGSESGEGGEKSGEHSGSESGEGGEGSGEQDGSESGEGGERSGEQDGSESGEGGEGSGEQDGSESGEGGERSGEQDGSESGEHSGSESGEGGEESGTQFGLNETFDEVRAGARLVLAYDPDANAFIGTVENTTGATLSRVRVEVHLSNGTELGPTTPIDLEPGQVVDVNLPATNRPFTSWNAHPEVG